MSDSRLPSRLRNAVAIAVMVACVSTAALADGFIQSLPPDGRSATLEFVTELHHNDEWLGWYEGTFKLSLVGTREEEGVVCRWIELEFRVKNSGGPINDEGTDNVEVRKYLIPEVCFTSPDKPPLEHVVRAWVSARGEVVALEKGPDRWEDHWLPALTDRHTAQEADSIELRGQMLKLPDAVSGRTTWEGVVGDQKLESTTEHTYWCHESVPFGVVRARHIMHEEFSSWRSRLVREFLIVDMSEETESALPDHW